MAARSALHTLEDLCEEQNDAMQEWLDTRANSRRPALSQAERDGLLARARDVIEHIQRVVHHVRRMEQAPRRPCRSISPRRATAPTTSCERSRR